MKKIKELMVIRRGTLKSRILRIAMVTLFITLSAISIVVFLFARYYLYDELTVYIKNRQEDIIKGLTISFNNLNLGVASLITDSTIYSVINDGTASFEERSDIAARQMSLLTSMNDIIGNAIIVTHQGECFMMYQDDYIPMPDKEYLESITSSDKIITAGRIVNTKSGQHQIMLGRRYRWFPTGHDVGYIVVYLNEEKLSELYANIMNQDGYSFLIDDNYTVISHPDKTKIGKTYLDEKGLFNSENAGKMIEFSSDRMMVLSPTEGEFRELGLNWIIVTMIQKSHVSNMTQQFNSYIWVIEVICALVALLLAFWTGFYILRPIERLKSSMMRYRDDGRAAAEYEISPGAEILELERTYMDMVLRIDELIAKNDEEKEKKREFELIALQAQINPHFLYNTLDTIVWYARIKKQPEIEQVTAALAKFFRMTLHNGDKLITVSEEITLVQSYITIEQIRFSNEIDIAYNIEEEILDIYILKLVLQPIVENALKHGIRAKKDGGKININGIRHDDYIVFEVIDNGDGFDMNGINNIGQKSKMGGYGLKNVDERLKIEYGGKSGVTLFSEKGKGTRVILKIKYK